MPDSNKILENFFRNAYASGDVNVFISKIREFFSEKRLFNQGSTDSLVRWISKDKEKRITRGEEYFNSCMDLIEAEAPAEGNYKADLIRYVYQRLTREYSREHLEERHISRITDLYERFVAEEQRRADQRPRETEEEMIERCRRYRQEIEKRVEAEMEREKQEREEKARQERQKEILEEGQRDISLLFPPGMRRRPSPDNSDSERSR